MAWYYGHYCEPIYVPNGDPWFHRDGILYQDPAPVAFRTPPFYSDDVFYRLPFRYQDPAPVAFRTPPFDSDDIFYRLPFRDQHPGFRHGGELIPPREQMHIRREDPYSYPYPTPAWWHNHDYPHYGGYPVWVVERRPREDEESTLEFYAPQLYSDSCERRVEDALRKCHGVENVVTDQWQKKVVVVGRGLREEHVLRCLRGVKRMERSVFWRDRR